MCSAWALRLWTDHKVEGDDLPKNLNNIKLLGGKTWAFDHCGAKDFKQDSSTIELGSNKAEWSDAAKFLNWLGLYNMDGFAIVIVDNTWKDKVGGKSPYTNY